MANEADQKARVEIAFPRYEQTFPALTSDEIARMRRFGEVRHFKDGEALFETGKVGPGMFVLLSGGVAITRRDGLGHVTPIIDHGPGQFLAELGQLSGKVALVDGHAEGEVETLLIPPERLRALLIAEADLGERIMRALILRRVSLIRGGAGSPIRTGPPAPPRIRLTRRRMSARMMRSPRSASAIRSARSRSGGTSSVSTSPSAWPSTSATLPDS